MIKQIVYDLLLGYTPNNYQTRENVTKKIFTNS